MGYGQRPQILESQARPIRPQRPLAELRITQGPDGCHVKCELIVTEKKGFSCYKTFASQCVNNDLDQKYFRIWLHKEVLKFILVFCLKFTEKTILRVSLINFIHLNYKELPNLAK